MILPPYKIQTQVAHIGIDWDGPLPYDGDNTVQVDPPGQPLCCADYQDLCNNVNPLQQSTEYGVEVYSATIRYVYSKIVS